MRNSERKTEQSEYVSVYRLWKEYQFRAESVREFENCGLIQSYSIRGIPHYRREDIEKLRVSLNAALGIVVNPELLVKQRSIEHG